MFLESFNNNLTLDMLYGLLDSILHEIGAKCQIPKTLARCLKTKQKEILAFVSSIEQQNMQPNQQEIPKAGLYHKYLFYFYVVFLVCRYTKST